MKRFVWLILCFVMVGCSTAERLNRIGKAPDLSPVGSPTKAEGYRPVDMPMPQTQNPSKSCNSLWQPGARSFFKDQRAAQVGDIVTILIRLDEKATFGNKTTTTRTSTQKTGIPKVAGFENYTRKILPSGVDPANLVSTSSNPTHTGDGNITRTETINFKVAALVTQILPNGNLVLQGRQEIRVNNEKRVVNVGGVVRREDVSSDNTVTYDKIAEARISYGGDGQLSDIQQAPYGQQFLDAIMPF